MMKTKTFTPFLLSIFFLSLVGIAACGGPKETPVEAEGGAIFMDEPQIPSSGASTPIAPADSPVSPVLETPPTPHPPVLPQAPETPNPTTGGIHQNENLRGFDPQFAFPTENNIGLSPHGGTTLSGNRSEPFILNSIYRYDPVRGLANIQALTQASSLTVYHSILRTNPEANRLEGNIRMRFPRHRIQAYPEGPGVFQTPVVEEYFPVDWIHLSLRACTADGNCQTLIQEIPFQEDSNLACDAEMNSNAYCEGDFTIKVLAEEISGTNLADLAQFEIRVSDTAAALLETADNQYQLCQATSDCSSSHPNCVGGLCSAIQPDALFEARP